MCIIKASQSPQSLLVSPSISGLTLITKAACCCSVLLQLRLAHCRMMARCCLMGIQEEDINVVKMGNGTYSMSMRSTRSSSALWECASRTASGSAISSSLHTMDKGLRKSVACARAC